jgi:hypothetical protein
MTDPSIKHFLIVYDIETGIPVVEEFGNDDEAATRAYEDREREHRFDPKVEVVLLGADSLDTIKHTHSSYFTRSGERRLEALVDRAVSRRAAA